MRPIALRLALHGLALAAANLGSILAAYAVYYVAFRPAHQLLIQAPLAAGLSIAAFVGWYWLVEQTRWGRVQAAWRDAGEVTLSYLVAFAWSLVLFVSLHFATQGYLTSAGNVLAIWAFQIPTNFVAVWLAWRVRPRAAAAPR